MIAFHCAKCGERVEFSENMGGQSVPCPRCREWIAIPTPTPGLPAAAAAPYLARGESRLVGSLNAPLAATIVLNIIGTIAGFFAPDTSRRPDGTTAIYALVLVILLVLTIVAWCVLVYRWWSCLPAGWRQTTPGKAVGLSFVPFYCFYWWFVAYGGLAADLNKYMEAHGIQGERVSIGLAHGYVILLILGVVLCWVPILANILGVVGLVLFIVFALSATRTCKLVLAAGR